MMQNINTTRSQQSSHEPRVHIFIYCWNNVRALLTCLDSLKTTDYTNMKVFMLNNGSSDQTGLLMQEAHHDHWFPESKFIDLPINIGAPAARNWLAADPENHYADYLAYFDDDIIVQADWLKKMVQTLEENPSAGVVGAKIVNQDNPRTIQHSGGVLTKQQDWINHVLLYGSVLDQGQFDNISERDYLMGCANLYRKSAFFDVGDFNLMFSPTQFDDVDHHLRMRLKKYQVLFNGLVEVIHLRKSGGAVNTNHIANRFKLEKKYSDSEIQEIINQGALKDFIKKHPWVLETNK